MTVITRNIGLFAQDATLKPTRRQYPDNIWINATRLKYTERNVSHLHKFHSDEVVSNIWHNSIIIIFARQCYFVVLVIFTLSLSSEKYRSSHISFSSKTNFRLTGSIQSKKRSNGSLSTFRSMCTQCVIVILFVRCLL